MLIVLSDFRIAKDARTAAMNFRNFMLDGKLSGDVENNGVSNGWRVFRNLYFTVTQEYLRRASVANSDLFDITGNSGNS
ncbi:hypothetical protein [Succinimonas amylolytica]|uniref:hypothetical protein n=1 Tax=Succinimonas amylolytica TaxID=83769 RepID=UPI00037EF8E8|nr:hypothetical protein [Succinimonas amylolytica]